MSAINTALVNLAEEHRAEVPNEFLREMDSVAADLASGRELVAVRSKGRRGVRGKVSSADIRSAILEEIRLFLCTNDPKYKAMRGEGHAIGKDVVHFMAGFVVATLGIASGMATGCVAFAVLACTRVGVAVFCRLNPPPVRAKKSPSR